MRLQERVADMLAENDACGPGPMSRQEYLDDAQAILDAVMPMYGPEGRWKELRDENDQLREALAKQRVPHEACPKCGTHQPACPLRDAEGCPYVREEQASS